MNRASGHFFHSERIMSAISFFIVSLCLSSCGSFVPTSTDAEASIRKKVLQNTPEEATISFLEAWDNNDIEAMTQLIDDSDESNQTFLNGFTTIVKEGLSSETINIRLDVVEKTDTFARVRANYDATLSHGGRLIIDGESGSTLSLVRKGDKWYFIGLADPIPPGWILER